MTSLFWVGAIVFAVSGAIGTGIRATASPARDSGANTALRDAALLATELGAASPDEKTPVQARAAAQRISARAY
jgi:hypothetical protein